MTDKGFHVGIIGGGIGGLALAQGLKKAGISVALYERDRTPTDRLQGYRVHISPKGSVALHDCLPSDLFGVFAATCSVRNEGFRFLSEKMEELLSIKDRGAASAIARHWSASRITLRQVLLSGLDGIVQFGRNFTHYEETADGTIVLICRQERSHLRRAGRRRRRQFACAPSGFFPTGVTPARSARRQGHAD
jgi:hypothetical protein